ncbi:MAG: response regulator [Candidatus Terrybacteria bacterium]|nr:response regulator [Candidatus Terrybacteria bacterium]
MAETPTPQPNAAASPTTSGASGTILVVEDDQFLRDLIVQKLKREGFTVAEAITGADALRMAKEAPPAIILLDLILPGMDGFEVLRQMKEDKAIAAVPVIILSNLGQQEDVDRGLRLGASDFMIKAHFTPGEIVAKVKQVMQG